MPTRRPGWRERLSDAWRVLRGLPEPQRAGASPLAEERIASIVPAAQGATQAKQVISKPSYIDQNAPPPLQGGRQTAPVNANVFGSLTANSWLWRRQFQDYDLAQLDIQNLDAEALLQVLADLSPDVSRAVWNTLRIAGTSLTFQVTTPTGADDTAGQKLVDDLVKRLNPAAGGLGAIIVQLITTAYLQGAVCMDIAPTEDLRDVIDFYPVNPATIFFQRDEYQIAVPYQRQPLYWGSGVAPFRRMNTELFAYTPIDPYVDDVYGRPPAAPVLQVVFFQVQVLRDLERVIHAQGWPKIDISVVTEVLRANMPPAVAADPAQQQAYITARMNEIVGAYGSMNPEDAYIHLDYVTLNSEAARAGSQLFDVGKLMDVIRSQIISALKQLPVLMGQHLGDTETFSTVERQLFGSSVEVFREPVGHILARAVGIALQLMGRLAVVAPIWAPIVTESDLQEAQARAAEAALAAYYRDQGWITQDDAAMTVTGSKAVGPAPAPMTVPDQGPPGQGKKPSTP